METVGPEDGRKYACGEEAPDEGSDGGDNDHGRFS